MTVSDTADPAGRQALLHRAAALIEAHQFDGADALCRLWLDQAPDDAGAIYLRGLVAAESGRPAAALPLIDDAIAGSPAIASWRVTRARVLRDLGRVDEAVATIEAAIDRDPNSVEAHVVRAELQMTLRDPAEALVSLERVIALEPDNVGAVLYATDMLLRTSQPAAALSRIDAELARRPDDARTHLARAQVMRAMNRLADAVASCDRAIEIQDDYAKAWFVKGLLLLAQERYAEGWPLYEWRWLTPEGQSEHPTLPQPLWDGSPLSGRTLLVVAEQGLGDTIQLFRFVTKLRRHARVTLHAPPGLVRLFATQPDAPVVIADRAGIPRTDLYCMMGSFPWLLGVEPSEIPATPYLRADAGAAAAWDTRLPGRPRVGIIWAGNVAHADDQHRSIPLRIMLDMLDPTMAILSLQKEVSEADRTTLRQAAHVIDLSGELTDFADTAAVMARLDLIISVDTAAAHLAGALGRPVWLLLAFAADWRWSVDREDSPWYPSARLFRQDEPGDWSGVAERVREALRGLPAPA